LKKVVIINQQIIIYHICFIEKIKLQIFKFFHGNYENIFEIEFCGLDFRTYYLNMIIIKEKYPGYSIYQWEKIKHKTIFFNVLIVYDWIKKTFNASDNQIFVCGRSLGTSPAIYLSYKRNP
jgi:hypothetical protein